MECFTVYFADRLAALFAVVQSPIDALETKRIGEYTRGVRKVEAATTERPTALCLVSFH
jgi:hypothetical protein